MKNHYVFVSKIIHTEKVYAAGHSFNWDWCFSHCLGGPTATKAHRQDSPTVGQLGRNTQPQGTAATLLPNTLCKQSQ